MTPEEKREKRNAYAREWAQAHPRTEAQKARKADWQRAHPRTDEQRRRATEQQRAYREADPDKYREAVRRYKAAHLEAVRKQNREAMAAKLAAMTPEERQERNRKIEQYRRNKKLIEAARPAPLLCEVCGEAGRVVYDHCHTAGTFRGWLCDGCNFALGNARDNPETLRKLAAYLEKARRSPEKKAA